MVYQQQERKKIRYCDRCWRCFNEDWSKNIKVVHDRNIYDVKTERERSKAYNYAATAIEKNLKISIHSGCDRSAQDGVNESTKLVTRQNEEWRRSCF